LEKAEVTNKPRAGIQKSGRADTGKKIKLLKKTTGSGKPRVRPTPRSPQRASTAAIAYHPGPALTSETALERAVADLLQRDPEIIGAMLAAGGPPPLRSGKQGFGGLAAIIISQQVSVASAKAILTRVSQAIVPLEAEPVGAAPEAVLQSCGLSRAKIRTLKAVASAVKTGTLSFEQLTLMRPEAAHAALVAIHGIGPWTADIFLLFCLGHPDAWPAGDLALQEAARIALNLKKRPGTRELQAIGERWRPWRAVAARILWTYYRRLKGGPGISLQ
jgi:DNA-3-methyladenine glycosylase II